MAVSHVVVSSKYSGLQARKCVTADTMLLTERGMVTVKELFEIEYKATCTTRDVEHNVGLINENGVIEKTHT